MPQNPFFIEPYQSQDITKPVSDPFYIEPYEGPSFIQSAISTGLRTVPAVGAGITGALVGKNPFTAAAWGAAGSGLGEQLAQEYEIWQGLRENRNPLQTAVQTGLGALPGFLKGPGANATAQQLLKYGSRAPWLGAGEGALLNIASTIPTELAETGELPSWEQMKGAGIGGALFGGAAGYGFGTLSARSRARGLAPSVDVSAPPLPSETTPGRPYGPRPLPDLVSRESFPPEMRDLFRQSGHTIEGTNAEGYEFMARPGAHSPLDTPISQTPDLPLQSAPESAIPNIVAQRGWTTEQIGYYESQGYVRGGVLPDGRAYMIRPGTPKPVAGQVIPEPPPITPMADPAGQARTGGDEGELADITFNADEGFTVPARQLTRAKINSLREQGYEQVGINDKGEAVFQQVDEDDVLPIRRRGDEGSIDPELLTAPYQALRRFTGPGLMDNPRNLDIGGTDILGQMEMRGQNQLENIGNAGGRPAGDIDLGPTPTAQSMAPTAPEKIASRIREVFATMRDRGRLWNWTSEQMATDPLTQRIRADITELENVRDLDEVYALHSRWYDEFNRTNQVNDHAGHLYASEMFNLVAHRLQEIRGNSPISSEISRRPPIARGIGEGPIEVFNPRSGEVIARFGTEEEARMYVAAHPGTDFNTQGRSAESQAFTQPSSELNVAARARLAELQPEPPPHSASYTRGATTENYRQEMMRADVEEIRRLTEPDQARESEQFWRDRLNEYNQGDDAEMQEHASAMLRLARQRALQLEETPTSIYRSENDPHYGTNGYEINSAETVEQLDILEDQWRNEYTTAVEMNDRMNMERANEMLDMISARRNEIGTTPRIVSGNPPPVNEPPPTNEPFISPRTPNRSMVSNLIQEATTTAQLRPITNRLAEELIAARRGGHDERVNAITDLIAEAGDREAAIMAGAPASRTQPNYVNEMARSVRERVEAATTEADLNAVVDEYRNQPQPTSDYRTRDIIRGIEDAITAKRHEIRGVNNPPITFGPQAPYKKLRKLTREENERLMGAERLRGETPKQAAAETAKTKAYRMEVAKLRTQVKDLLNGHGGNEQNIPSDSPYWTLKQKLEDSDYEWFARSVVRSGGEGPPGLSIDNKGSSYGDKNFYVVYRSPEGKPVMVAKVLESSAHGGRRVVTAMGLNRDAPVVLQGRAFLNVGMKLMDIGAGEASDTISQFTANAIRRSGRLVRGDEGFIDIGAMFGPSRERSVFKWMLDKIQGPSAKAGGPSVTPPVVPPAGGGEGGPMMGGGKGKKKPSFLRELYNFPRAITTTLDLSAPLRQGLPLIFTKEWRNSWSQMVSALRDEGAFQKTLSDLRARPIFQSKMVNGKIVKSFAEQAGIKLMDLDHNLGRREEATASTWVEKILPGARASNRAYTAFLNQLRADSFENLLKAASKDAQTGIKGARNPYTDMAYAKEIADFVNTATGRGPLKTYVPSIKGGTSLGDYRPQLKERSIEQHTKLFTDLIFSPRLMASRVRMLNPATYMMASPFVRKQYLNSLLSVAGAWGTTAVLAKMAGADVSMDPTSADFGKIRIGNTRIDAAGGFQQYLVSAVKFITGHTTSSNTGRDFELGKGYRAETRLDIAQRFGINKLHPVMKFAVDLANASEHQPFQVGDRAIQMFIPLIIQDTIELAKEDPSLLPLLGPIGLGAGSQTYDKGESISKFIPKNRDFTFGGGSWYPGDKR